MENNLESHGLRILGVQAVLECVTNQWCNSFISSLQSIWLGVSRLAFRIDRFSRRFQINDDQCRTVSKLIPLEEEMTNQRFDHGIDGQ